VSGPFSAIECDAECETDDDCPFLDKCHIAECEPDGTCMQAPIICNDNDPCTDDVCEPWTGQCLHWRDFECCRSPDDCFDSGNPCTEPLCVRDNETAVSGRCSELNKPNCCNTNDDCVIADEQCLERLCNHQTYQCETVGPVDCGADDDNNLCTVLECVNTTGECVQRNLTVDECPGACCLPDGHTCIEQDELWCDMDNGTFFGINTTCEKGFCGDATPAPPTAEPTDAPTYTPTAEPSNEPTPVPPTPAPTDTPTAEPTPVPPTPAPTFAECPPRDECYVIGGECQPIGVECPAGSRAIVGPCEPGAGEEPCCHCCVPCAELHCPGHPEAACDAVGPCSDYAYEPPGEPEERVCEMDATLPCTVEADCACRCDPANTSQSIACEPRFARPCSACEAPACDCTRACGLDGTCQCYWQSPNGTLQWPCDAADAAGANWTQVCSCDEPLGCCFSGVTPGQECALYSHFECEQMGGTPTNATECGVDVCPRACRQTCDCSPAALGDLCLVTQCTDDGLCASDRKINCPSTGCADDCAQREQCGGECSGINIENGRPFSGGECVCWCRSATSQQACSAHGHCPVDMERTCACAPANE